MTVTVCTLKLTKVTSAVSELVTSTHTTETGSDRLLFFSASLLIIHDKVFKNNIVERTIVL